MAAISSTVGAQAAAQAAFQQLRVQQAKRSADQAELAARTLREEADSAQRAADRAQAKADSLYARSAQARTVAGQARQGTAISKSVEVMQARLVHTANQIGERQAQANPASAQTQAENVAAPVVNTSGQVTGTVVNVAV